MKSLPPSPREVEEGAAQVTTSPAGQAGVQEGPGEAVVLRAGPGNLEVPRLLTHQGGNSITFSRQFSCCYSDNNTQGIPVVMVTSTATEDGHQQQRIKLS